MRRSVLTVAVFLLSAATAAAEWHIKPFVGLTFGGGTTFVDPERAVGAPNFVAGVTGGLQGEVFGIEGELGWAPGFFQARALELLLSSSVTTLTGNLVAALPQRIAEYTLRPYLVAGAGMMHVQTQGRLGALPVSSTLPTMDFGGGATGFFNERVGLNWEIRRFRSFARKGRTSGVSFGDEQLSFWRATMAVAIRY
jgi:hypothetical protein